MSEGVATNMPADWHVLASSNGKDMAAFQRPIEKALMFAQLGFWNLVGNSKDSRQFRVPDLEHFRLGDGPPAFWF